METMNFNQLRSVCGGSCPYCDGKSTGASLRSWFGTIWDRMREGAMITQSAMQRGK